MKNLFQRRGRAQPALGGAGPGALVAALVAADQSDLVPPACTGVGIDALGHTRRVQEGARLALAVGEQGWCFHPGPYSMVLTPFLAAPEMGLQLVVVVDSPDPLVRQQRFDLYLASEGQQALSVGQLRAAFELALQRELAQGSLALPPCTLPDEWNAFRAGLNELLYMRFGVTVDDCIPVDLAGTVDYAALLALRAVATEPAAPNTLQTMAPSMPASGPASSPAAPAPAIVDGAALRRLFLELPALGARLRLLDAPGGVGGFARQRALLQRFDHASLAVSTMPALALAAPNQPLAPGAQGRRARHASRAVAALDESWALLARAGRLDGAPLFDELERITANLEHALAARRQLALEGA